MADDGSGEKTEEPTQKKIDDSRKKGQVWKSKDFAGVGIFLACMGAIKALWPTIESDFAELFRFAFESLAHPKNLPQATMQILAMGLRSLLFLSLPIVLLAALVGGIIDFLQVGALFAPEAIKPKLEKLNPVQGLKNLFSKKQMVELIKNLLKISISGYVVFGVVRDATGEIISTIFANVPQMLAVMGELMTRVAVRVGLLLLVFSIFDIWWQRRAYYKDLMMTKDEVKREYKESEGDPHYKAQRKAMHQEILESAQMEAVKGADVVVTNPDHVAVALQYQQDKDQAPRVVCRGIDTRAQSIKELARKYEIPLMRNVPLAHALLRVDVGEEIPDMLYDAVAEVLTFVYGLRQGAAAQGASAPQDPRWVATRGSRAG